MTQEKFKLPRSSYEELSKIIVAYGSFDKPAGLEEVAKVLGISKPSISANNAFLSAIGIIEGGNRKIRTNKGMDLAKALEHDLLEEVKKNWRQIVEDNDFLQKMNQAVRIRKGMEISSLQAHIAYSAGEPKTSKVMTGARTAIDILLTSGLVKEDNNRIIPEEIGLADETSSTGEGKYGPSAIKVPTTEVSTPPDVSLHIEVRIDAKPSELDGLGEKLKVLIKTLSNGGSEGEKSGEGAEQEG